MADVPIVVSSARGTFAAVRNSEGCAGRTAEASHAWFIIGTYRQCINFNSLQSRQVQVVEGYVDRNVRAIARNWEIDELRSIADG